MLQPSYGIKYMYVCTFTCPHFMQEWTLSMMMSKNKNGGYSWGTLHGMPMERLVFRYDRHEESIRYIWMRHIYYYPMVIRVFCVPLKVFGWLCYSRRHKNQFNTPYLIRFTRYAY